MWSFWIFLKLKIYVKSILAYWNVKYCHFLLESLEILVNFCKFWVVEKFWNSHTVKWRNGLKGEMSSILEEERCILSFNYKGSFCHPNFLSRLDTSFASDRWNKQSFCIKVCNKSHFWKHRILPMLMEWYIWRLGEGLRFHKNRNGKEATLILKW